MKRKFLNLIFNPCITINNNYIGTGKIKKKVILLRIVLLIFSVLLFGEYETLETAYGLY